MTESQPYIHREPQSSVTVARNSYVHARIHLHMLTVPNSEVEILNILTRKVMLHSDGNSQVVRTTREYV